MNVIEKENRVRIGNELVRSIPTHAQSAKKAPAATRMPTTAAPTPVTLGTPLLPPLEGPVGTAVEGDEDVPVERVVLGVTLPLKPGEAGVEL